LQSLRPDRERRLFSFLSPALRGTSRANLSVGSLRHASCIRCALEPFSDKVTASKRRAVIFFFENGGTEIQEGRNLSPPVPKKAIFGRGGKRNEIAVGVGLSRRKTEKQHVRRN